MTPTERREIIKRHLTALLEEVGDDPPLPIVVHHHEDARNTTTLLVIGQADKNDLAAMLRGILGKDKDEQ